MTVHPRFGDCLTQHWRIDHRGDIELLDTADAHNAGAADAAASGTVTPVAASGWIDLHGEFSGSLAAGIRRAATLTQTLNVLDARFPGYRWFVRDGESRRAA